MTLDQSLRLSVFPCFASTPPEVNVSFTRERNYRGVQTLTKRGVVSKYMKLVRIGQEEGRCLMAYDTLFHQIYPSIMLSRDHYNNFILFKKRPSIFASTLFSFLLSHSFSCHVTN